MSKNWSPNKEHKCPEGMAPSYVKNVIKGVPTKIEGTHNNVNLNPNGGNSAPKKKNGADWKQGLSKVPGISQGPSKKTNMPY